MTSTKTTTPDELEAILSSADTAATQWAQRPATERAVALNAVAEALDAASGELVPIGVEETHLPIGRLTGELKRTTFQLRLFAELLNDGGFYDAPDEAAVRRAREAVSTPIDRLHALSE